MIRITNPGVFEVTVSDDGSIETKSLRRMRLRKDGSVDFYPAEEAIERAQSALHKKLFGFKVVAAGHGRLHVVFRHPFDFGKVKRLWASLAPFLNKQFGKAFKGHDLGS